MAATTAIEGVASIVGELVSLVNGLSGCGKFAISRRDSPRKVGMPFWCGIAGDGLGQAGARLAICPTTFW